jgi:outer membrane protein
MSRGLQAVLSITVAVLTITGAAAGEDLSLRQLKTSVSMNEAQAIALKQNRDVLEASLEVRRTEATLKSVVATRFPKILALAFTGQQFNSNYGWDTAVLPGVLQPLTQQYRLDLQVRDASLQMQTARQHLRLTKQHAVAEVKRSYLSMLAQQSAILSFEQDLVFLNELERYVDSEVQKGAALPVDLQLVQARVARADFEVDRAKYDLNTLGQTLNRLLGRPPLAKMDLIEEPITAVIEMNENATIDEALAKRPELAEVKFDVHRSHLKSKIELSRYIPDISVGVLGTFSHNFNPPFPGTFTAIGFTGVWEPWDWGRRIQLNKESDRAMRQSKLKLLDLSDSIAIDADKARRAMKVAEKEAKAGALAQTSTQEQLRVVDQRFKVGAALLKDVLEAQAAYTQAIAENVKAKTDLAAAQVNLDEALGRDF